MADVRSSDVVYDLGCGDGRLVVEAARQMGARGVGIDLDPQRIKESVERERRFRRSLPNWWISSTRICSRPS